MMDILRTLFDELYEVFLPEIDVFKTKTDLQSSYTTENVLFTKKSRPIRPNCPQTFV